VTAYLTNVDNHANDDKVLEWSATILFQIFRDLLEGIGAQSGDVET